MRARPTIDPEVSRAAKAAVPAPDGYAWLWDPAATADRLRLFPEGMTGPQVGAAYADGDWFVEDPDPAKYMPAAQGTEADLHAAMGKVLEVASQLGWNLGNVGLQPEEVEVRMTCAVCGVALEQSKPPDECTAKAQIHVHVRCIGCNPAGSFCVTANASAEADA